MKKKERKTKLSTPLQECIIHWEPIQEKYNLPEAFGIRMSVNDKELDNKYRLTHLRELGLVQLELLKRQLILEEELKFLKNSMDEDEHQENVYTILDEFANFSSELKKTRDMESFEKIAEKIDSKFGSMYVVGQGKSELLINPITGEVIESRMLEY